MCSDSVIEVRNVAKCYQIYEKPHHRLMQMMLAKTGKTLFREFWALRDISFEIPRGKIVGILGKNGAGKSTLLQMICGTLSPSQGAIRVNGRVAALLELGSGFNPEFTGVENIYMNGQILGLTKDQIDAKMADILEFADIGEFVHQPVKTYSSGMFARLAFSVVIHVEPDVLIVDEALSVGDAWFQHKSMARMRKLMESGCTVLFVSHSIDAVRALCDEAIWLDRGTVKMQGDVTSVTNAYMNDVFLERNKILLEKKAGDSSVLAKSNDDDSLMEEKPPVSIDPVRTESGERNSVEEIQPEEVVKIVAATILNSSGLPTETLLHNEKFKLQIDLLVNGLVNNLNVGFIITDQFGQQLVGGNLLDSQALISTQSNEEKYCVIFSSQMKLRGGQSYAISIRFTQGQCESRTDMVVIAVHEQHIVVEVLRENEPSWLIFDNDYHVSVERVSNEK